MWRTSLLGMATLVLAAVGLSVAEDAPGPGPVQSVKAAASTPAPCSDLKWGAYEPLTFWRKLKLGTAVYVNPDTARRSSVSYVYSPALMQDPVKAKQVFMDFQTGNVSLAQKKEGGAVFLVPPGQAKKAFAEMATQPKYDAFLHDKGYVITADKDLLAGVKSTQPVVSFDPTTSCTVLPEDKSGKEPPAK
jgi:hypothetical protein